MAGVFGRLAYFKHTWFRDTPNTLTIEGELHPVPFRWSEQQFGDHKGPHYAMMVPVSIPGFDNKFCMQSDTRSPSTFIRSGALESLIERGCDVEL
ncbi:MAG: hypothetical protein AB8G99_17860 [Planctomycetaceae bacterium]